MISTKNKKLLCEFVDFTCEVCHKKFDVSELCVHRIRRGYEGGTYEHRNCMILCVKCHKSIHTDEF